MRLKNDKIAVQIIHPTNGECNPIQQRIHKRDDYQKASLELKKNRYICSYPVEQQEFLRVLKNWQIDHRRNIGSADKRKSNSQNNKAEGLLNSTLGSED